MYLESWDIYSDERKGSQNGRMDQSKPMEHGSLKASPDVLKPRYIYIYTHTHIQLMVLTYGDALLVLKLR
jgi:hypothetical protein